MAGRPLKRARAEDRRRESERLAGLKADVLAGHIAAGSANEEGRRHLVLPVRAEAAEARRAANSLAFTPRNEAARKAIKQKFLEKFAETKSVAIAALHANISRTTASNWKASDPEFARRWDEAWEYWVDRLEVGMMERATDGFAKPVFQNGVRVGTEQVHHPALSMFMLARNRRERYGDPVESLLAHCEKLELKLAELEAKLGRRNKS